MPHLRVGAEWNEARRSPLVGSTKGLCFSSDGTESARQTAASTLKRGKDLQRRGCSMVESELVQRAKDTRLERLAITRVGTCAVLASGGSEIKHVCETFFFLPVLQKILGTCWRDLQRTAFAPARTFKFFLPFLRWLTS